MSKATVDKYRELEKLLEMVRNQNGDESEEERIILQNMDSLWYKLAKDERRMLARENP